MTPETQLHHAVRMGDCARAARLLADGADPCARDGSGRSALDPKFAGLETLHRIRQEYQSIPSLLHLCCDSSISRAADSYLRKPAHLKRTYAMRYPPSGSIRKAQFRWHHDMEDKQMKAMILLTDVGEDGQCMAYVRGSHRAFHPYERFQRNRLDFEYCGTYLGEIDIVKTTGNAGDVFLFDSNGMHRGNRFRTAMRDAVFLEYTADLDEENLWGTELERSAIPASIDCGGPTLGPFLAVRPKWQRARDLKEPRRLTPWVTSLEDPSRWLSRQT